MPEERSDSPEKTEMYYYVPAQNRFSSVKTGNSGPERLGRLATARLGHRVFGLEYSGKLFALDLITLMWTQFEYSGAQLAQMTIKSTRRVQGHSLFRSLAPLIHSLRSPHCSLRSFVRSLARSLTPEFVGKKGSCHCNMNASSIS